jgi:D-glycero-D-manno-heptose 1,7-bisphosphate phosphatase
MNTVLQQKKLVILDRDGVINEESVHYIKSPQEWIPIPGSLEAIAKLTAHGIRVAVATNQAGIGRGLFDEAQLNAIHQTMIDAVAAKGGRLDKIVYCPHHPQEGCACRKPNTGLLDEISDYFKIDLTDVPFIGDSEKDILAAQKRQCQPMLVKTGYGQDCLLKLSGMEILVYENLQAAVNALLAEDQHGNNNL